MLASIDDVKDHLHKESNAEDGLIELLLSGVSAQIEGEIGSAISPVPVTQFGQGNGLPGFLLDNAVVSITSVAEGSTVLADTVYRVEGRTLVKLDTSALEICWPRLPLKVVYRAGFSPVPDDLQMAAVIQTAFQYRQTKGGGNRLGLTANSPSEAGEAISYVPLDLLPDVMRTLKRYRSIY